MGSSGCKVCALGVQGLQGFRLRGFVCGKVSGMGFRVLRFGLRRLLLCVSLSNHLEQASYCRKCVHSFRGAQVYIYIYLFIYLFIISYILLNYIMGVRVFEVYRV